MATVAENIQKLRVKAGFETQTALARATGMSLSQISDLEGGRYAIPDTRTLVRLATALTCSVDDLLHDVDVDYQEMLEKKGHAEAVFEALSDEPEETHADVSHYKREDIPVIQEGEASPDGLTWDAETRTVKEADRTSRPYDYRETGAYAVVLRGDSMEPLLKRGMRLIVSVAQPIADGDLVYVQLKSGERLAKIATRQNGGWLLSSANAAYGPRFVSAEELGNIHKVAYVRFLK